MATSQLAENQQRSYEVFGKKHYMACTTVTLKWLLGFLVQCFAALPDHLHVQLVACQHDVLIQRLEVEADELASFVQKKANKQWVWIAMDATTRQIIAFHVGDRSHK